MTGPVTRPGEPQRLTSSARRALGVINRTFFRPGRLLEQSTEPVARFFGRERGTPIDRYYIERFLDQHRELVRGRALEIADDSYIRRYGDDRVTAYEVLHVAQRPGATIVGDLTDPATLPEAAIDAFVCTQTLNFIYDVPAAVRGIHRLLAPGGVVLATLGGISQISVGDASQWGDYWRFTPQGAARAFGDVFGPEHVTVDSAGNVFAATSFLRGIAVEEVPAAKLDVHDPEYPMTVLVIARKA